MRKRIAPEQLQKLFNDGVEPLAIAQRLGVAPSTVYRHLRELRKRGQVELRTVKASDRATGMSKMSRKRHPWRDFRT